MRRFGQLAGLVGGLVINLPCYLFLLLASSTGLHWWKAPWSEGVNQYLLALLSVTGMAVAIVLVFVLVAMKTLRARRGNPDKSTPKPGPIPPGFNMLMIVVSYPVFAAWAWSAQNGRASSTLLMASVFIIASHVLGATAMGLKAALRAGVASPSA